MRILALALSLLGIVGAALAAPPGVELVPRPDLTKGMAAFPHLAPSAPFAAQINAALDEARKKALDNAADCKTSEGGNGVERYVDVTMRGPRFLSFLVTDNYWCGAHPDSVRTAFVYDLTTGELADWNKLLPSSMAGKVVMDDGIGLLNSAVLRRIYVRNLVKSADPECKDVIAETDYNFLLWPDAKKRALVLDQNDFPHVVAACGGQVELSLSELRGLGVSEELITTITEGQPSNLPAKAK
jgi:hypothetical protein